MKRAITFATLLAALFCATHAFGAGKGPVFSGKVVRVDAEFATFAVRGRGATVTFDASQPVFRGYRGLSDVRVGDLVLVSYVPDGVSVTRQTNGHKETNGRQEAAVGKKGWVRNAQHLLRRVSEGGGDPFEEADLNRDGRITPMELSTVIPDLTLEQFKKYDKGARGYLDKAQFDEAVREARAQKRK